jgi:hypothetical protein
MNGERRPKKSDLLTSNDVADLFGWPVARARSLINALARDGMPTYEIEGFRRKLVRRGDLEARIVRCDYDPSN